MPHRIISTTEDLRARCAEWAQAPVLALDTEFIRERTYYPQLCLIQVATENGAWAIDPLAEGMDLSPFFPLLSAPHILKLFHAARQDLEIFYRLTGSVPAPLFDTQVAVQSLGYGESIGYEALVQRVLGKQLDKGARFTDWAKRPLSQKQLEYALADVIYLLEACEKIVPEMEQKGRLSWVREEMDKLLDPALYDAPAEDAWKRLRLNTRKPAVLAALRALAAWREREAKAVDRPRGWLVKDDLLTEIASALPKSAEELSHLRGVNALSSSVRASVVKVIGEVLEDDPSTYPSPAVNRNEPNANRTTVSLLQMLLDMAADKEKVTPRLIATRDDLENLVLGKDSAVLHGWRREAFGETALRFLQGGMALGVDEKGDATLVETPFSQQAQRA